MKYRKTFHFQSLKYIHFLFHSWFLWFSYLAYTISLGPTYAYGYIDGMEDISLNAEGTSPVSGMDISIRRWDGRPVLGGTYMSTDSWWRHQIETFSALLAICAGNSPVRGEFPTQRPVTRSFDVFFFSGPEYASKQSWGWWFETPSGPLWRHSNVVQDCNNSCGLFY